MRMKKRQVLRLVLAIILLALTTTGLADERLNLLKDEYQDSFVEYPQVQGLDDTLVQDSINTAILENITPHLNTLLVLKSGTSGQLQVTSKQQIFPSTSGHEVLSILMTIDGRQPAGRSGYLQVPLMFDLNSGQQVTADMVFTNVDDATAWLEEHLLEQFSGELSNYLDIANLTPFPIDNLLLTDTGITFYYPINTMTWLSGRSASIHLLYHEITPLLRLDENDLLTSLGVKDKLIITDESSASIELSVSTGKLPGLDAVLGEPIEGLIKRNKLQYDPEGFPEGELYQLENDAYRGTLLITADEMNLSGILTKRMNLFGLIIGKTSQQEVESLLGKAIISLPMSDAAAQLYRVPEGVLQAYVYGENELRLYFDNDNIVSAVWLKTK